MKKSVVILLSGLLLPLASWAETPEEFRQRLEREYEAFSGQMKSDYESFRDKVNRQYAEALEGKWSAVETITPLIRPSIPDPGPVEMPEGDNPLPGTPEPVIIIEDELPCPDPQPRPRPYEPVAPSPKKYAGSFTLDFYGTPVKINMPGFRSFSTGGNSPGQLADAWRILSRSSTDNLLHSCLEARESLRLPDWYYMLMAQSVAKNLSGTDTNAAVLLTGYLLSQSGFDIRFARSIGDGSLHLLFSTSGTLYGRSRYNLEGKWYYALTEPRGAVSVCEFSVPGETPLSLAMGTQPKLSYTPAPRREIDVHGHPGLKLSIAANKNLIDLLGDYPDAALGKSEDSRWTPHALMPLSDEIRESVIPVLRKAVEGLSQYEAVNLLLKVAQSFPYGYDSEIWGKDRVFFMDESWYYPLSDCEDHAINFVQLVREILGLDTAFIVYPNHLSAAVAITDGSAKGDYFERDGKRYTGCDATYFYASAGATAPEYRNQSAGVLRLK